MNKPKRINQETTLFLPLKEASASHISKRPQSSSFNASNDSTKLSSKCLIDNESHRIWNSKKFKTMSADESYAAVKEKNLCFSSLGEKHSAKECQKSRKCGFDGCDKTHNRLLHQKTKRQVSAKKSKDSTILTSNVESVSGFLEKSTSTTYGRFEDTLAACDTGSTQMWAQDKILFLTNLI